MGLFEEVGLVTLPTQQIKELYHYTTKEGLLGILNNNQIWGTHIDYLNDSTELSHGLHLANNELKQRYELAADNKEKEKITCLLDELDTHRVLNISVSCLTEERDLLSQWRAYGSGSGGYSIGFNVSNLIKLKNLNNDDLVKVEYGLEKQKQIMSRFIDKSLIDDFNTESTRYMGESVKEDGTRCCNFLALAVGGDFIKDLYSIAPCFKDPSFKEESEWKLISRIPPKDICFRTNQTMLVPYKNLDLGEKSDYLTSITIAPNLHMDLSIKAVKMLMSKFSYNKDGTFDSLINQNMQKINILQSKTPYRAW